jgi:PAS domain S-box-containing protein
VRQKATYVTNVLGARASSLQTAEQRFHHLVDAVTDYAIFMLDASGNVATWNAGAQKAKGYTADEIIGRHFSVFYTPEDREAGKPQRILDTVRREGRYEEEGWRVRKDGSRFWASVVITALQDEHGTVTGFAKVTRDLTARRAAEENERALAREQAGRARAEEERRRMLTLLEQVPATVNFFRGPDLVFEFAHPRALESLGTRDVVGKPLLDAMPEQRGRPYYARLKHVYDSGHAITETETLVRVETNGQTVDTYWDAVFLPIRDAEGAIEGVMSFELDVTSRVRAREALERMNRAKDEFLATMSHELRTPLNAISGWTTLLRRDATDAKQVAHGLEVIERNAKTQMRIINDLLDVSRIVAGKLQLAMTRMELSPIVHAAAEVVRPAAESKGVRLVVDVDPEVGETVADADRLQQIIWNLLINAVRFTPRGGRITVAADRDDSAILIRVTDTGVGIAADNLAHIFERFRQIDSSTTRTHGGLGLGLAIVRHLVEAHGGTVGADSEGLGHGATFTVRLPIRATSEVRDEPAQVRSAPDLAGVNVLVVDDEPDALELVRVVLEAAGARVSVAKSASEALGMQDAWDLIVSDIGMPMVDGYTYIQRVRSRNSGGGPPAIALSAYARVEDVQRALRAGFQEHLSKPVDQRKLLEAASVWSHQIEAHVGKGQSLPSVRSTR